MVMTTTLDSQNLSLPELSSEQDNVTWQWQTQDGLPYLTCSLLEPWHHGFFTKHFSPRTPADLVQELHSSAKVFRVKQVHGNTVLKTGNITPVADNGVISSLDTYPEADGIITEGETEAVWVCSADCVPVLIADSATGQVAAVHAGWRGTASKIVPEAIAHFFSLGSHCENLRVVLGPAIAGEVYQVSLDVVEKLGTTIAPNNEKKNRDELIEYLHSLPQAPILADAEPGKIRVDIRRFNLLQLEQLGIKASQVAIAPFCTFQTPDYFCSYRRDNVKKVQWSGIVSHSEHKVSQNTTSLNPCRSGLS
jgi:YfiH family protein